MQKEIKERTPLLDGKGRLTDPGYAKRLLFDYSRKAIKASGWRIKEWDYYCALNSRFGISFTIADLSYSALISAVFFDFTQKKVWKKTKMLWFTFGKLGLPASSEKGDVAYHGSGYDFVFERKETQRLLTVSVADFGDGIPLKAELRLDCPNDDTMVIATPWEKKPKAFYLNQKINCLPVTGKVTIGSEIIEFDPADTLAVLDWGRGVWTYKNTWYWGSASGWVEGKRFGFNIGYGFGDTRKATENMLFYDGKAHKLDQIEFHIDSEDFLKPWHFTSNDGRLELTLEPILDRQDDTNFVIIKNLGHQVFGKYSGSVILDDGTRLEITNLIGFAEKITNHY